MTLPSRLRPYFEGGIVVTKGVDRCLFAFPPEEWAAFKANIKANTDLTARGRQLSRMFFSMAFEATLDRQGRVLIPTKLARYAGLQRDVTITALTTRSPRSWRSSREGTLAGDGDRTPTRYASGGGGRSRAGSE
jgi:MraZ protein